MKNGYTLYRAVKIVIGLENTPLRLKVFDEICELNKVFGCGFSIYKALPTNTLKGFAILTYCLKNTLSLSLQEGGQHVATGFFPNEKKVIKQLQEILPELSISAFETSKKNILRISSLKSLSKSLMLLPPTLRIATQLARRYHFMPACRAMLAVAYYLRMNELLENKQYKGVIIASNYSPDAVALAAAAHKKGRRCIYINHAPVPAKIDYLPPVHADLSILSGEAAAAAYRKKSAIRGNIVYKGLPGSNANLNLENLKNKKEGLAIGIFLGALSENHEIISLIDLLESRFKVAGIQLRPHPVNLINDNYSAIQNTYRNIVITNNYTLEDQSRLCDLVFCGNTSASLEVLKAGTPVAYWSKIDTQIRDYCGFVETGLIPSFDAIEPLLIEKAVEFYSRPDWEKIMISYDAAYKQDRNSFNQNLRTELKTALDL